MSFVRSVTAKGLEQRFSLMGGNSAQTTIRITRDRKVYLKVREVVLKIPFHVAWVLSSPDVRDFLASPEAQAFCSGLKEARQDAAENLVDPETLNHRRSFVSQAINFGLVQTEGEAWSLARQKYPRR